MSTTNGTNNNSILKGTALRIDMAIKGCQNAFPPGVTSLPVRNVVMSQQDILNKLVALDAPWQGQASAKLTVHQFAQDKPQYTKQSQQFLGDLKQSLAGAAGADNTLLAQWGFPVKKQTKPLTSEEKVLRAAKAKLTRKKRGTLGKRQKAAIKQTTTPTVYISSDGTTSVVAPSPNGSNGNGTAATNGSVTSATTTT